MSEPLDPDALDAEILARLRRLHQRLDPVPPDLNERVIFALTVAQLNAEVAGILQDEPSGAAARATERVRRLSFAAPSLTIVVAATELPDGRTRLDGWLAPPSSSRVELRLAGSGRRRPLVTMSDEAGRFAFPGVPHGPLWLVVSGGPATVVTPVVTL
jgi:hypothetical protein